MNSINSFVLKISNYPFFATRLRTFAIAVLLTFLLFGVNIFAKFWIIDDHEIVANALIKEVSFSAFKKSLLDSEIGKWGESPRYRPAYYFAKSVETIVYGPYPWAWYSSRLFFFIVFAFVFVKVLKTRLDDFDTVVVLCATCAFQYWSDIEARLGPAEHYALLGSSLFFLALTETLRHDQPKIHIYLLLLFGFMLASGSKENFLILIIPMAYLVYRRFTLKQSIMVPLLTLAVSSLFAAWIAGALVTHFSNSGLDVYSASVAPADRATKLSLLAKNKTFLIVNLVFMMRLIGGFNSRLFRLNVRQVSFFFICLNALIVSQYIFYNGEWPTGMRYDFPGQLALPIVMGYAIYEIRHITKNTTYGAKLLLIFNFSILIIFTSIIGPKMLGHVKSSWLNVQRTQLFDESLSTIRTTLQSSPAAILIVHARDPFDLEPVISLERFLRFLEIRQRVFIKYAITESQENQSALTAQISKSIQNLATPNAQLSRLLKTNECYSIFFRKPPESPTICPLLSVIKI